MMPLAMIVAMIVPGGMLDPAFPDADVYLKDPVVAVAPDTPACAVAKRYVELINAGDYAGVAALYADDATFLEPMRPNLHGRKQIDEFYVKRIGSMKPKVVVVSYTGTGGECSIMLALRAEIGKTLRYTLVSIDHFSVSEDGKIRSMTAFSRPTRRP